MLIVFRCSAGGNHGWGNLKRLELIHNALKKKYKYNYKFIIDANSAVKKYLHRKKIEFFLVNKYNEDKILKRIGYIDLTIIELLNCTNKIQKKYKDISKKLFILDDITKKKYISDILISCQKKKFKIKKEDDCKFFNDYKFFPVNESFNRYIKKKKKIRKKIKHITIFIGGSSYDKVFLKIARGLKLTNYQVTFLIGNENSIEVRKKIKMISNQFEVKIDSKKIPHHLFISDVIICGGGYTKIEAAYLKTPIICLPIHEHQKILIKDFLKDLNLEKNPYVYSNKFNIIKSLNFLNFRRRKEMMKKFSLKFKENGINNILKIINANI